MLPSEGPGDRVSRPWSGPASGCIWVDDLLLTGCKELRNKSQNPHCWNCVEAGERDECGLEGVVLEDERRELGLML